MKARPTLDKSFLGQGKINVSIDRGGTFTDCYGVYPVLVKDENGVTHERLESVVIKLLSEDPTHYPDAPQEGIRRILEIATGIPHPRNTLLDTSNLGNVRMGTTVATNALLERKGERTVFLVTKGFKDLLQIGNQARPNLFDLSIKRPEILYDRVIEVEERVTLAGYQMNPRGVYSDEQSLETEIQEGEVVKGVSQEYVRILKRLDLKQVEQQLREAYEDGIRSVAVCFLHSYTYPEHENLVGELALKIGFKHASLSNKVMAMIKAVPRGHSAVADGYLSPAIKGYIKGFQKGFDDGIKDEKKVRVEFMQSDGGLAPVDRFTGLKAVLSGPAGGVVGYGETTYNEVADKAVIGLDIGGTSTDVSRYSGELEHVFETTTAGVHILAPQLDIMTVAAGGGSRLFYKNGLFLVGPESAGANPGPACYRKKGPLTITDANLVLGRLQIEYFPKVFGENEDEGLGIEESQKLFSELVDEINNNKARSGAASAQKMTVQEAALGFIDVACEAMCRPIRKLTEARGFETSSHALAAFGGAGPQHACSVAEKLGISHVFVHKNASILSAYGISLAKVVEEQQIPSAQVLDDGETMEAIYEKVADLKQKCESALESQEFSKEKGQIDTEVMLHLRYEGTDTALMIQEKAANAQNVQVPNSTDMEALRIGYLEAFKKSHKREFGFILEEAQVIVDDIRVRATGQFTKMKSGKIYDEIETMRRENRIKRVDSKTSKAHRKTADVYFDKGYQKTEVYGLEDLEDGDEIKGPAIILDNNNTIVVEPNWNALVSESQVVLVFDKEKGTSKEGKEIQDLESPAQMSVFLHRFMSIAEQMGNTLQKTSISTNIKERLDFSCALFDSKGQLVANAPHIPVHLGSMSNAVKFQINYHKNHPEGLREGDVICTNHPAAGGTHLPDITIITPVFSQDGRKEILFYVASRGHHADIGGIAPGSMPPNSKHLYEEGAAILSFKIVNNGVFCQDELDKLLVEIPAQYEGCEGSRRVSDVLSDLKAQIAANQRGISLVNKLIDEYSIKTVQYYMDKIQLTAELAVRNLLSSVYHTQSQGGELLAEDYMDDGSKICLSVKINKEDNYSAVFDFSNSSNQVYGNTNAPVAVTHSAILYALRSMIPSDLPLNQGCLVPITTVIPSHSILNPGLTAAVVGGNVLTSQRVVDVIFKCFKACAASQGCMNNFTFGASPTTVASGDEGKALKGWGYYETIAGGHGAGPTWDGESGVHTHMTNTRITDPEILERRYPVILRTFSIRENSGGRGQHPGGNGVIRDLEFLSPLQVSLLTERRVFSPYGLEGGEGGQPGQNLWLSKAENTDSDSGSDSQPSDANSQYLYSEYSDANEYAGYLTWYLGSKASVFVKPGDRIVIKTPGAGGWGTPL